MKTCDLSGKSVSNARNIPNVGCQLFPTLVAVEPSSMTTHHDIITPSYVSLHRCSGGCNYHSSIYRCTAIEHKTVNVKVSIIRTNIGKRQSCVVQMRNETRCACNCVLSSRDCDPIRHEWSENSCQCICKKSLKDSCRFKWNEDTCACECEPRVCEGRSVRPLPENNCQCNAGVLNDFGKYS